MPDRFPKSAFHPVPDYGIADSFVYQKPEPATVEVISQEPDHQQTVGYAGAFRMYLGISFASRQTVPALHGQAPMVTRSAYDGL